MPRHPEIRTVLVIGSGPIIIGQAAEFDYAGTQACKSLRAEGIRTILVNSNPATIMTDLKIADEVYIEPLTVEFLAKIIEKERPDGLLPTLGGQTGLNLAVELHEAGVLDRFNVRFLGTPLETIRMAEDRQRFKSLMEQIGEPVPSSAVFTDDVDSALEWGDNQGYPLIVRPAYTLGGTGGGIAYNRDDLKQIVARGFHFSPINQVLIETSVIGWKEIEYEVMRDSNDNCITICNMENIDPMGVHTGDSVVVAPSQTLSDYEYQMLRSASINIIRSLRIEGGCNVQLALDPDSFRYYVIEVNPRVSRSSALASKATGYPIAKVAAKIAIGLTLDEIINEVTGATCACFEPALDYLVMKIPRWPFDKFHAADRHLGTQMKATGEVMAIARSFAASLMKAIRSLEIRLDGLYVPGSEAWAKLAIEDILKTATDERLFVVLEGLRRGYSVDMMHTMTGIDRWFLDKFQNIVNKEKRMKVMGPGFLESGDLKLAKRLGFSDDMIARATGLTENQVRTARIRRGITPTFKMVDTCAAEFEAETPYYYSSYDTEDEVVVGERRKVIVIGSGPIRIGQGVEFDYCSVHSALALREIGFQSLIINNNPETVSTDFDTSDRLYFEPLTVEDVMNVIEREKVEGVIVQFGGQTAINLSVELARRDVRIFGTGVEGIQLAEDRERFDNLLGRLKIRRPSGGGCYNLTQAKRIVQEIGYPVLVRPSFVIGGQSMEICRDENELRDFMVHAVTASGEHPVLVDHYVEGQEVEVDLISDGETVVIPGIMEHIERAGIHSGDSMAVYPPQTLSGAVIEELETISCRIARALGVKGVLNIQFIVSKTGEVYVLEVNPRASRTVPFLSKVTGVPMVYLGTVVCMGKKLREFDYRTGIVAEKPLVAVKAPVFSFSRLNELDIDLGPQMKSTGEIMGVDRQLGPALYKALLAAGIDVPHEEGNLIVTVADRDKEEAAEIVRGFLDLGYNIWATSGTADYLEKRGINAIRLVKISEGAPNPLTTIQQGACDLLINTLSPNRRVEKEAAMIRKASVERSIPCFTSLDTARAMLYVLRQLKEGDIRLGVNSLREILGEPVAAE